MKKTIYLLLKEKNEGTLQSFIDKSHKPHSHPNQHTELELKLISDMRRRNPNADLIVFQVKLRQREYTRSASRALPCFEEKWFKS